MAPVPRAVAFLLGLALAACSTKPSSAPAASADSAVAIDAGNPAALAPATGTIVGSLAFPVAWALLDPNEPTAACTPNAASGGGYAALAIELCQENLSKAVCGDGGAGSGGSGMLLSIGVATIQFASGAPTFTKAVAPGTYTVGNEGAPDETLCMLPAGATAIVQLHAFGQPSQAIATSGTVTIDSVTASSIEGSFDVQMGGPDGDVDAGTTPLGGSFHAAACP